MKQLNAILSGFNKTLTKLDALVSSNSKTVDDNTARIDVLKQQNLELTAEAQAAKNVASNIRKMIEGEVKGE